MNPYLHTLRKRRGLDADDNSADGAIEKMTPMEQLKEVVAWELGDREWATTILHMAHDLGVITFKKETP